uniref:COMM domain-containing protein n=1 Tax=Arcella intermedia TaxID=1963864 RepID=A0A6B2LK08_9EUKA
MIVVLSEAHKKDLAFLGDVPVDFVGEFCRLMMDFLRKGVEGRKLFVSAAKKLGVAVKVVECGIDALCYLFIEAAKLNLKEQDFVDSLLILAFSDEHNNTLKDTYVANKLEIRNLLTDMTMQIPHFSNLDWRFDMELSSRTCRNLLNPLFILQIETETAPLQKNTQTFQLDYANLKHLTSELEMALDTTKLVYARRVSRNI